LIAVVVGLLIALFEWRKIVRQRRAMAD